MATEIFLDGIGHVLADKELNVPVYQRSFSWGPDEVHALLSDLWDAFRAGDPEYFLGSIVVTGSGEEIPSVVDGQQRLAVISMIYAGIRDFLYDRKDKRKGPMENKYLFSLNFRTEEIVPKLRLNEMDNDFFRKHVLSGPDERGKSIVPTIDSHKRITNAYKIVKEHVMKCSKTSPKDEVGILIDWADYLEKKAKIILVVVPDDAKAFVVFETLNDRGLDLSIADLLKNYIFGKSENRLEEARTHWIRATGALEGTGGDKRVATFIRHFWSSKQGLIRERDLYGDLKKKLKTKQSAIDFSVELADNARLYAAILNSDHDFWQSLGSGGRQLVQSLLYLKLEQYRPLLLACLHTFPPKEILKTLKLLVSWNVRLLVVGGLGGGTIERYYSLGGKKVRDKEISSANELIKFAVDFIPGDAEFEASFSTARVSQAYLARYYLQALEQSLADEENPELVPSTLEKDVNLEHVLPQSPRKRDWPTFDEESVRAYCKRLGNLTLMKSDENVGLGNKPFLEKRIIYSRSKLKLNADLAAARKWDKAAIESRQKKLAEVALSTWPLKTK